MSTLAYHSVCINTLLSSCHLLAIQPCVKRLKEQGTARIRVAGMRIARIVPALFCRRRHADILGTDRVFLIESASFVPAVRRLFAERFGAVLLRDGDELTTATRGLALH